MPSVARQAIAEQSAGSGALPLMARRSVTFDRGSEFVTWPHLQAKTGTRSWPGRPQSPHQKGTVENTNRRARRWWPGGTDIRQTTDADIRAITDRMNATPPQVPRMENPRQSLRREDGEDDGRQMPITGRQTYRRSQRKAKASRSRTSRSSHRMEMESTDSAIKWCLNLLVLNDSR